MQPNASLNHERRRGEPPIPTELDNLLTSSQQQGLDQVLSFGWQLAFVRHPLLEDPTVVVTPDGGATYAMISPDGELDFNPDLRVRH